MLCYYSPPTKYPLFINRSLLLWRMITQRVPTKRERSEAEVGSFVWGSVREDGATKRKDLKREMKLMTLSLPSHVKSPSETGTWHILRNNPPWSDQDSTTWDVCPPVRPRCRRWLSYSGTQNGSHDSSDRSEHRLELLRNSQRVRRRAYIRDRSLPNMRNAPSSSDRALLCGNILYYGCFVST